MSGHGSKRAGSSGRKGEGIKLVTTCYTFFCHCDFCHYGLGMPVPRGLKTIMVLGPLFHSEAHFFRHCLTPNFDNLTLKLGQG